MVLPFVASYEFENARQLRRNYRQRRFVEAGARAPSLKDGSGGRRLT